MPTPSRSACSAACWRSSERRLTLTPLSLNALRLACNQSTNRDPVVEYDEPTIRSALDRLARKGWVRLASGHGSRAVKFRHLLDEALRLADDELALLAVLMLRGPQTPGELKQRTERLHRFESLAELEQTLDALIERELAERLQRAPGQKEERFVQRLGGGAEEPAASTVADREGADTAPLEERVRRLEEAVEELRDRIRSLGG